VRASDVTLKPVTWLEFPFVPLGKITAVAGQMGQAKSLWACWLASKVTSTGGRVIALNAEDDAEDTIVPRLKAAGAELGRVWIEPGATLDVEHLDSICNQMGDVRLITIDPIAAFLPGNVNSWKAQDVRRELEPIRQLAGDRQLAVVLVQHLNRRSDAGGDPLARIADSQGIPQLARSVLVWGPDPADPEGDRGAMKALTKAKGNLSRATASATFTIVERVVDTNIVAPALVRGDDRDISADDVVSDADTRSALDEAAEWLRDVLADGPLEAKDIYRQARENGISERTLKRAKRPAGVVSESSRVDTGISGWRWSIKDLGPLGTVGPLGTQGKEAKEAKEANNSNGHVELATDEQERLIARMEAS
jgi:putative DNA primase/helicase